VAIEVGQAARDMMGRTPANIKAIRPLKDGVISDIEWAEVMLRKFIEKVIGAPKMFGMRVGRVIICVPSGCTEVERSAVGDAAYNADAQMVNILAEPMAAAIGAGMPVTKPTGSMIVDIGGGTTEIAVLSMNGMVVSKSLRVAGDEMNENIQRHLKMHHNLAIGERTAEAIKIRLGSAFRSNDTQDEEMEVRGISLANGLPYTVRIHTSEIRECMIETLMQIVDGIKSILEETPPELAADIVDRGIMLAGGGALLPGLDELIQQEVDVPVQVANDALSCVVLGTERILTDPVYTKILDYSEYIPRI
jgi:rod shape-determining protein MreB and related proteins